MSKRPLIDVITRLTILLAAKACTAAATLTTTSPKPEAVDNGIHERRPIEDKRDDIPTRSLASLCWPPDPLEDGLNALNDPLNRDEPKPLLHSELLAIGIVCPVITVVAVPVLTVCPQRNPSHSGDC